MIAEHTVETPPWIKTLVEDLVPCVTPYSFIGPLGYCYTEPADADGPWEVNVYPTPNEFRGCGPHDGAMFTSGFELDVARVLGFMQEVGELVWRSPAKYNGTLDGPEVCLVGRYTTRRVRVRFFSVPPPDEPPAYAIDPATSRATELPA